MGGENKMTPPLEQITEKSFLNRVKKVVRNFCLTALIGVTILSGCYGYKRIEEVAKPSPEQTKIAFVSDRDGNVEIYVMNADGSEQINLTNNPASDYSPSWSPFLKTGK